MTNHSQNRLLLSLFSSLALFWHASGSASDCFSQSELVGLQQEITQLIELSGGCNSNNDCVILKAGCEFGCQQAINKDGMPLVLDALSSYRQLLCEPCRDMCATDQVAMCVDKRCQAISHPFDDTNIPNTSAITSTETTATTTPTLVDEVVPRSKFGRSKFASPSLVPTANSNETASSTLRMDDSTTASSTPRN